MSIILGFSFDSEHYDTYLGRRVNVNLKGEVRYKAVSRTAIQEGISARGSKYNPCPIGSVLCSDGRGSVYESGNESEPGF